VAAEAEGSLAERLAALEQALARAEAERDEYRQLYLLLREENEKLKRGLLGQKAERLRRDERPLALALLDMLLGEPSAAPPETRGCARTSGGSPRAASPSRSISRGWRSSSSRSTCSARASNTSSGSVRR
jgi:hypothetical protein